MGSGCDSVGRVVTSNARVLQFESSHRQTITLDIYLLTVNCIENIKRPESRIFLKNG